MTSEKDDMNKYYSEWWENPKDIRNVVFNSLNNYISQRISKNSGTRALDIGSGPGRIISYLVENGYDVSSIEINEQFCEMIRQKFPNVTVHQGDLADFDFKKIGTYDLITTIELIQNLNKQEIISFLKKIQPITNSLYISISNSNCFHTHWINFRGWKKDFVYNYSPDEFTDLLTEARFEIVHERGFGFLTPVSLFDNFKGKIVPRWFAAFINKHFDERYPKQCHLYYYEAITKKVDLK